MSASPLPTTSSDRLVFVDIFRGLAVAGMILVDNPGSDDKAYWAIQHAQWNGWTPADFIFPSFLLLVGGSLVYSITRRLERGDTRLAIMSHVAKRSLALIAIGLFVNTFPFVDLHFSTLRFYGVTQRIAVCYFVAAILLLWAERRALWMALIFCLVGYWIVLRFVPVPGFGIPGRDIPFMDPDRNIAAWLDRKLMMGHLYNITRDPEGLLSTIPSIATTLIGVLTGYWLRSEKKPIMKVTFLTIAGVLGMLTGFIWDIWFPINKNLWTSSFVLFTGGFALLFLSFLYWAVAYAWR
jgi:predicted acyltransferase